MYIKIEERSKLGRLIDLEALSLMVPRWTRRGVPFGRLIDLEALFLRDAVSLGGLESQKN